MKTIKLVNLKIKVSGIENLCLIILLFLLPGCSSLNYFKMRESDKVFNQGLKNSEKVQFERYRIKRNHIRYCHSGSDSLPVVLFIHGAPASLSFWKPFFQDSLLKSKAELVAVDRPGYGYSSFGRLYLSYYTQASLLAPIIEKYGKNRQLILVGSSYGGPLCALLAARFPEYVSGLLLVSSSIAPGEEAIWNITHLIDSPLGEFFPRVLQVATAEKIHHRKMLEEIKGEWSHILCPLVMLHGSEDELIFPTNVSFVYSKFWRAPKQITILGGLKHNIVDTRPKIVVEKIMELLNQNAMVLK
ncbi:MAG: alpha/beta hydrolase [Saprospiraceae bacterium]|nr:alpha/beta hydrolase [Saprospiraceae bacterium]